MAMISKSLKIDEERFVPALQEAGEKLNGSAGEVILDLSCVSRIVPGALRAMETFAAIADDNAVKVVLHNVDVNVYRVLKLVKLASRFTFTTGNAPSPD